jgi:hypothetical protein
MRAIYCHPGWFATVVVPHFLKIDSCRDRQRLSLCKANENRLALLVGVLRAVPLATPILFGVSAENGKIATERACRLIHYWNLFA